MSDRWCGRVKDLRVFCRIWQRHPGRCLRCPRPPTSLPALVGTWRLSATHPGLGKGVVHPRLAADRFASLSSYRPPSLFPLPPLSRLSWPPAGMRPLSISPNFLRTVNRFGRGDRRGHPLPVPDGPAPQEAERLSEQKHLALPAHGQWPGTPRPAVGCSRARGQFRRV